VLGRAWRAAGDWIRFSKRGPVMAVLSGAELGRMAASKKPPRFTGSGVKVGVFQDGYGAPGILPVVRASAGYTAEYLTSLRPAWLAACDVVILPQPRSTAPLSQSDYDAIKAYVKNGGKVLLTHDAVGYRSFPVLFPSVCQGGRRHVAETQFTMVLPDDTRERGAHTYYDHIILRPGRASRVLARAPAGNGDAPVAVAGPVGAGRVAATGLAIGLASDNTDTAPTPEEARLLRLMLSSLAQK